MTRLLLVLAAGWAAVVTWHVAELARARWQQTRIESA